MQRISQRLTGKIKELAERYDATLPGLEDDVERIEKKVRGHLGIEHARGNNV
jgi:type I restriction enzyme M protein